jgi:hypothetical protein
VQRKVSTTTPPFSGCRRPAGGDRPTRRSDIPYRISPPRADSSEGLLWLLLLLLWLLRLRCGKGANMSGIHGRSSGTKRDGDGIGAEDDDNDDDNDNNNDNNNGDGASGPRSAADAADASAAAAASNGGYNLREQRRLHRRALVQLRKQKRSHLADLWRRHQHLKSEMATIQQEMKDVECSLLEVDDDIDRLQEDGEAEEEEEEERTAALLDDEKENDERAPQRQRQQQQQQQQPRDRSHGARTDGGMDGEDDDDPEVRLLECLPEATQWVKNADSTSAASAASSSLSLSKKSGGVGVLDLLPVKKAKSHNKRKGDAAAAARDEPPGGRDGADRRGSGSRWARTGDVEAVRAAVATAAPGRGSSADAEGAQAAAPTSTAPSTLIRPILRRPPPPPQQQQQQQPFPVRAASAGASLQTRGDDGGESSPLGTTRRPCHPWDDAVVRALQGVFRIRAFRDSQRDVIDATLAGQDVFVLMRTGGGKSLTYQLPALLEGRGVEHGKPRKVCVRNALRLRGVRPRRFATESFFFISIACSRSRTR